MTISSDLIALIALGVSVLSLMISGLSYLRDRTRIITSSTFYDRYEDFNEPYIRIRVVNHGRRVAVLRMVGGTVERGKWSATYLKNNKQDGLTLSENQFYEKEFYRHDLYHTAPDSEIVPFQELWVEDSIGKRHEIRGSKSNIKKLFQATKNDKLD